ncbi:DUF2567 domain-containing protein [Micromonospora krabiensis]|uniref:DUF2567 domain-containing protein n=1 Tax=Micromonospora krabiensis TaxID=307121 RepID=A0A1C3ND80_9ACTN|nr:hypothetical protein GA0070620_6152 [Micromonospora krabiensis]
MSPDTPDHDRSAAEPGERDRTTPTSLGAAPADPPSDAVAGASGGAGSTGSVPAYGGPTAYVSGSPNGGLADPRFAPPSAGVDPAATDAAPAPGARRRTVLAALGAGLALTVLGAPLGLLWAAVAPDTPVIKAPDGALYGQPQPEQPIAADGWFSLLGLGFGVLAAVALWIVLRRRRGPVGLVTAVLGALAAGVVAWQVGRRVGLGTFERLLATAPDGQPLGKPADLRAGELSGVLDVLPVPQLLLPAFGAAIMYTLLAGWSRWPSLRPEPEPDPAGLSWASGATPAPSAAPEPPAPGAAEPPRG